MQTITRKMLDRFKEFLYESEKSDNTVQKYMRDIEAFVNWLGKGAVNKSVALAYKKQISEKYAPASVNSMLSSINMFF